jgi:superfamily II RNA helicase
LEQLRRDTDLRAHSVELREKEWDLAARLRERALADAREHVNVLMKELATDRAELRARDAHIADLESQLEEHRRQLATVIARAIAKNRVLAVKKPRRKIRAKPKRRIKVKKYVPSKRSVSVPISR